MNLYTKTIVDNIKPLMKEAGFVKKGMNWCYKTDEVISVLNLQKSSWGDRYYINLGLYLVQAETEPKPFPPESHCHIRIRATRFLSNNERDFYPIFDMDNNAITLEEKIEEMKKIINVYCIPYMKMCGTINGIREYFTKNKALRIYLSKKAMDVLDLEK